ncbi:ABC transporter permease [Pseudonocardia lutea]|uniref:ABC transporter permease n=1 Tax=Pseudonocardia lutea TaxID=2172015 RepID=A0ABW1I176_9PSEU
MTTQTDARPAATATVISRLGTDVAGLLPLVVAVVALFALGAVTTAGFAAPENIRAVLIAASITGIVAVSMTFLTLSGNYVSLGVQQSTVLAALLFLHTVAEGHGVTLAILVSVLAVVAVGVAQGIVVALGMNTIITTLATGSVLFGITASASGSGVVTAEGKSIGWLDASLVFGLPIAVYGFVAVTILATLISARTVIGRKVLLAGANRRTARLNGISATATTLFGFVALSLGAAIAGVLTAAQLGQATASDMPSLTIDVVAAVLVGGTAIAGGYGSPIRSALGAITIALLNNVMVLNNFATGWRFAIQGLVVVGVVCLLQYLARKRAN